MIRRGKPEDCEWFIEQATEFHKYFPPGLIPFPSKEYCEHIYGEMCENGVMLIYDDGERKGLISGLLTCHPMNPSVTTLTESMWWVTEAWRGSSVGYRLLNEYIRVGHEETCADVITISLESTSKVSDNTLSRLGFTPIERNFFMRVPRK